MNCPFGWCSIQALGRFKPNKGGHIVLWEPKKVIEFPHAATIHIPSATITHSNIPVGEDETRVSFTQYCAGGIFRWVDNGFRTEAELAIEDQEEYQRIQLLKESRWEQGVSLFSTASELNILEAI